MSERTTKKQSTDTRRLIKFFAVTVMPLWRGGVQRIVVTPERGTDADTGVVYYLSAKDATLLIAQLQHAVKRAPRAT